MAADKKPQVILWTPVGMFSYPYFSKPDVGRQQSDGQYKTDLFIPKTVFKEHGKELQEAVLKVGRDTHGKDFSLKNPKFRIPFKDTDTDDEVTNERQKNCIFIRAKAGKKDSDKNRPVTILGPRKVDGKFPILTEKEILAIKGGDWGRLNVAVFAYSGNKLIQPGVTFALRGVQFARADEGFGQGAGQLLETVTELENETDDIGETEVDSSDDSII